MEQAAEVKQVCVSFLPTREDYCDYKATACRAACRPRDVIVLRAAGVALVLLGIVFWAVWGRSNYVQTIADCLLVLLGILLGSWQDTLMPYFIRRSAGAYYDANRERMISKNLLFAENMVEIHTDRYKAHLHYDLFFRAYEDKKMFLLYIGEEEIHFVPKRALTEDQAALLHGWLSAAMGEKFHQEGTR